jgi:ABC-2 type transport system permease protein
MSRLLVLARKEMGDILRERSILLALLTQFFVAAFSAFLTVGLVGLYDPDAVDARPDTRLAYVGPGGFDQYLDETPNLVVHRLPISEALQRFQAGDLAAIIEETYTDTQGARTVTFLLPEGEIQTTLLVTQLKDLLRAYEKDLRVEREHRIQETLVYVATQAKPNAYYGFAFTVLLPLLVLTPVFLAGATTGDSLAHEFHTHTIHLLRASPLRPTQIVLGKLAAPVFLVPAQVLLWCLLLGLNGLRVSNLGLLLVLATALGLLMAAASILVASLVRREGQTQAAYALLVLVLLGASLLLPRDPLNLVARLGVGHADASNLVALGLYLIAALATLALAVAAARRRLRHDG